MTQVLLIDNDSSMRRVIRLTLERDGAEVTEAEDGPQGLDLVPARPSPTSSVSDGYARTFP